MANTRNSPTGGELSTGDVPQDPHPENAKTVEITDSVDISDDLARQYPEPVEEGSDTPEVEASLDEQEETGEAGETWVKYLGSNIHSRGLTTQDQMNMGIPKDKVFETSNTPGHFEPGLWLAPWNNHRANITGAHPALVAYMEEQPEEFAVTRY